jgi:ElaB/YqjD/DUF883 family membrane-anchored ribosome-binding protein
MKADKHNVQTRLPKIYMKKTSTTKKVAKVATVAKRAAAALEKGKKIVTTVRTKAVAGAKATDKAVRKHPYRALGVAVTIGAVAGALLAKSRSSAKSKPAAEEAE